MTLHYLSASHHLLYAVLMYAAMYRFGGDTLFPAGSRRQSSNMASAPTTTRPFDSIHRRYDDEDYDEDDNDDDDYSYRGERRPLRKASRTRLIAEWRAPRLVKVRYWESSSDAGVA